MASLDAGQPLEASRKTPAGSASRRAAPYQGERILGSPGGTEPIGASGPAARRLAGGPTKSRVFPGLATTHRSKSETLDVDLGAWPCTRIRPSHGVIRTGSLARSTSSTSGAL